MRSAPGPFVPILTAVVIVLCGIGGAVLAPGRPRRQNPPGLSGSAGGADAGAEDASPQRVISATQQTVESASPVVRWDGVLVESLGIESPPGAFLPLLQAGQRMPIWKPLPIRTEAESPQELLLHLVRGRSARVEEDHSLGWYRVSDLPPAHPGSPRAVVILRIAGGSVLLAAIDPGSGRGLRVAPAAPPAAAPTPEAAGR